MALLIPSISMAKCLPLSSWQVYKNGILTVYKGNSANTEIYYSGPQNGYDGGATSRGFEKFVIGLGEKTIKKSTTTLPVVQ